MSLLDAVFELTCILGFLTLSLPYSMPGLSPRLPPQLPHFSDCPLITQNPLSSGLICI